MTPEAKSGSVAQPTRRSRPGLLSRFVLGVFLSVWVGSAAESTAGPDKVLFEEYEVVTGAANRQTVVTGFLLGGAVAELAVLNTDENDDRRLRIYAFEDGTWVPRLEATLAPQVVFIDVANIVGHDRLVTYQPGRLNWFDPESATERALLAVTSSFIPPHRGEIPHVDITQDVNRDGRDDLVLPDVEGFWVSIQLSDGAFADPVKIGPSSEMSRIYGADGYRYSPWAQSRVYEIDYDQDGRSDLVFWREDHFEVHLQDERGLFGPVAQTFTTEVSFDSDQLDALATGDMTGRVLHSLADLNGDGVGDLVVHSLEGRRISSNRSTCEVHFGKTTPQGGTVFARGVDIAFQSDNRIQIGMDRQDFDGDGQIDLMFTTIEMKFLTGSLWKRLKGFMGDDVWLDLEFYRMDGGDYPETPNAIRRRQLDGAPSPSEPGWVPLDIALRGGTHERRKTQKGWPRAFNTTLLIGDVTGDGRSDLLIEHTFRGLHLYVGVPGPDLFDRLPQEVAVILPNDREYSWLVDLNQDGKQDILMHHPFTLRDIHGAPRRPPGTEPHRVTVLMAR